MISQNGAITPTSQLCVHTNVYKRATAHCHCSFLVVRQRASITTSCAIEPIRNGRCFGWQFPFNNGAHLPCRVSSLFSSLQVLLLISLDHCLLLLILV